MLILHELPYTVQVRCQFFKLENSHRTPPPTTDSAPSLLDRVHATCRRRHFSRHTETSYRRWIIRYVRFHDTTHPRDLDASDARAFLNHLAVDRNVAASTQNQALSALVFLYDDVLDRPLGDIGEIKRADRPKRLPTVLSKREPRRLFAAMDAGPNALAAHLLYGAGLRLSEALRLRVKDLDFDQRRIVVRDGKGGTDRTTILPDRLRAPLQKHLRRVKRRRHTDQVDDIGVSRPAHRPGGRVRCQTLEACHVSYASPLICDSSAAGRRESAAHSGPAGS